MLNRDFLSASQKQIRPMPVHGSNVAKLNSVPSTPLPTFGKHDNAQHQIST